MHESLRKLPSLDPLKGFEAAARHMSFTRAASELLLTQSAISRQIQTLEEQLGMRLFRRETRRLALTSEGEVLYRAVAETLARLADVCAGLRAVQRRPRVTITAAVGISSLWLVPRLAAFQLLEPDLDVLISADNRIVDLEREGIDLALRYDDPESVSPAAAHLFDEVVFPVAAPVVAAALSSPLTACDIANATLLNYEGDSRAVWQTWEPWLHGFNLAHVRPKAILQFNQYDQLIRAAEDGRGIALGRGPLVMPAIAAGRLVALTATPERIAARAYYLVRAPGTDRPEVDRFAAWLLDEARQTKADADA
jgi:DNA-binding transcriptional LysR family regulator